MTQPSTTNQTSLIQELKETHKKVHMPEGCCGGIIVSFSGPLNKESLASLVTLSKNAVLQCGLPRAEMKKVSMIVNDCLQNTLNYGWIDENGEILIYFTLNCVERGLRFSCGKFVSSHMTEEITRKIDIINSKSDSELRKRSVELICDRDKHTSTGSELNIINIAQNCTGDIEYNSQEQSSGRDLFTTSVLLTH